MITIKRGTLEAILLAARNTFPNEFIALLSSKHGKKVIDEYVLLPSIYGKSFSSIRLDLMPHDENIRGSVHSHPSRFAMPSNADLRAFKAMGETHLIVASPFSLETVRAFDKAGKSIEMEVIE